MGFKDKNELKQYLASINLIYAKYTEGLWAEEVNHVCIWLMYMTCCTCSSFPETAPLVMLILS